MAKSKYQNYDTITINRQMIKNAPYNPRIMDESAKKRLRQAIRAHGLVSALTWNKRTGNLVGGHQRLEQLDALEKSQDYELTVCAIDVDEREEAILNVQLNNQSMQGEWDLDKLSALSLQGGLDLVDDLGFTKLDVDFMFDGDDRFSELYETPEVQEVEGKLEEIKNVRGQSKEKFKEKNGIDWYTVIVFADEEEREAFMRKIGVAKYEQYVTAEQVERISGHNIS